MAYNVVAELFAEWAIGMVVIIIRLYTRWSIGQKNFYWDDGCLLLAMVCWTVFTVTLYYCTDVYGSNIGLNEETAALIPDEKVPQIRKGSICAFVAWVTYIGMVWAFKGVLVFLYNRLTTGLSQHRLTMVVGGATVFTFLVSFFFHLFDCMPIHKNWQVKPYPGDKCTLRPLNYILIETLSIVNDLAIMCVPIPLIIAAKIPPSQKIVLIILFSSGIFVMICSVLRAYYSVRDIAHLPTALGWASREGFVSAFIVCAPGIKPLFTRIGWFKSYGSSNNYGSKYTSNHKSRTGRFTSRPSREFNTLNSGNETHPYELSSSMAWNGARRGSSGESQEHIMEDTTHKRGDNPEHGIVVTTDVTLAHEDSPPRMKGLGRR
ncbi:hypothetical protein ETB97_007508 [Aspergillus alliaceus]|uniref:Rhodopsin domain-containing protein n=1 Tax=Petromyces alliaceus TaxID=209559 RepID=A0A5N7CKU7_PETAA|nr:hypothetical protein BDV23DRAFT_179632 [Aspergillus alliaceus]KAF5856350.1 hypothetical protein ETB97_007508 [Aspergillus burnettii]